MTRRTTVAAMSCALVTLAGCGSGGSGGAASPQPSAASSPATTTAVPTPSPTRPHHPRRTPTKAAAPATPTKVLVVIEENHSYAQMRAGMPYLAGLSDRYGYATHWSALAHPSEPNYLAIAGGSTFGVTDDAPPSAHYSDVGSAPSVFDQALTAGKTAATYAESMTGTCETQNDGRYAVRHNPWTYFRSGRTGCVAHDVGLPQLVRDAAGNALPNVGFLIPDLDHDAHDGTLATADAWLRDQLGPVLASRDFTSGRLVVVVTADEDDKHSGNQVLTTVLSPRDSHLVVTTPLTHYSLSRYLSEVLGVPPLGRAASAPDLRSAFGL